MVHAVVPPAGANCAFIAFISSNLTSVLHQYEMPVTSMTVVWCLFPVLAALSLLRNTTYLAPTSHIGNVALVVGIGAVFWFGLSHPAPHGGVTGVVPLRDLAGFSMFFGIAAFALS